MGESQGALRQEHARVERIEAHRLVQAFNRAFGIAGVAADPTATLPGDRQVHIQVKRPIDEQQRAVEVAKEIGMDVSRPAQRNGVILADIGGALDQAGDFALIEARGPAIRLGKVVTRSGKPVRSRKIAVLRYRRVEQLQRLGVFLSRPSIPAGKTAEIEIVSRQIAGHIELGAIDLRFLQLRRYRADHAGDELILQIENVDQIAVKPVRPQMAARTSASMNCPVTRTRLPDLRTLPSNT